MFSFLFGIIWFLVSSIAFCVLTLFWIWMIADCATNEPAVGNERLIWLLVIVFTYPIGPFLYYIVRRPERIRCFGA